MAFAIGTFDGGVGPFPGIVVDEATVHDASSLAPTTRALFEDWPRAFGALSGWRPPAAASR